jgi:hypothetical protein
MKGEIVSNNHFFWLTPYTEFFIFRDICKQKFTSKCIPSLGSSNRENQSQEHRIRNHKPYCVSNVLKAHKNFQIWEYKLGRLSLQHWTVIVKSSLYIYIQ